MTMTFIATTFEPEDFPAAHSMDSTWFAVDRDGNVAIFDTGEAGAMPDIACGGEQAFGAFSSLVSVTSPTEILYDLRGRLAPFAPKEETHREWHEHTFGARLIFLDSLEPVRAELESGAARKVPATEGVAVIVNDPQPPLSRRLHDEGHCRGCFWHWEPSSDEGDEDPTSDSLLRRGFYGYSHLTENWISGPYGRETVPKVPLHIDQLPPSFRQLLSRLTFSELSFAETTHIQPVEHTPCISWESEYMDLDGEQHPMP